MPACMYNVPSKQSIVEISKTAKFWFFTFKNLWWSCKLFLPAAYSKSIAFMLYKVLLYLFFHWIFIKLYEEQTFPSFYREGKKLT